MTEPLFASCIRGARAVLALARDSLSDAIARRGPEGSLAYPGTAYEIPVVFGLTDLEVTTLRGAEPALSLAEGMIRDRPTAENALDAGAATLLCADILEALGHAEGRTYPAPCVGFVPDSVLRKLGIFMVDGSVPGVAVVVGRASDPAVAASMVRDFQEVGLLVFLAGDVVGQVEASGIKMGEDFRTFPLGPLPAVVHAVNFAVRAGLTFGGLGRGQAEPMLSYLATRVKAFVCALGPLDDLSLAIAAGAMKAGFPVLSDQAVPAIPGALLSCPPGEEMVRAGIEARGIKAKIVKVPVPIAFGPSYEGERIRKADTYAEFGGGRTVAYELVTSAPLSEVRDREIRVVGPDIPDLEKGGALPLGLVVTVAGARMQKDFESVLERRIHRIVNFGEGTMHVAQRDTTWIRISDEAVARGFRLADLGTMIHAKMLSDFENIVDRVAVTIHTREEDVRAGLAGARTVYAERDARARTLTDDAVGEFYSCTLCQSFAPNHVCIVTPERLGLCGAINWLDGKAGYEITPTGPNQPVPKGDERDPVKGAWEGVNAFVREHSRNTVPGFNLYSIMEAPMTSCGCFECILALVPEANGFMVVNREYAGAETPCGMGFSTLAGSVGGGVQTPGFMGVGKQYLLSRKFLAAEGGLPRIVWMTKEMKEQLGPALAKRAGEIGMPDLLDKIADETIAVTPERLREYLEKAGHPALSMKPLV
ncbi:MAG: CO dehydrogenase/CO-methylating acetyl-CoA synthase complex subunit beta [Deltaproteobacteria bacterium]|nr:MAG: CO dehydrogenase/CO-methylating acetyl-CoA synthase complex subunit beta [Deltaproteobacteria bacterium]